MDTILARHGLSLEVIEGCVARFYVKFRPKNMLFCIVGDLVDDFTTCFSSNLF
jgi:hypothetical protein